MTGPSSALRAASTAALRVCAVVLGAATAFGAPPSQGAGEGGSATATARAPLGGEAQQIDLRVLYVGSANGPRTEDFLAFLRQEFTSVGHVSYPDFRAPDADAYDVVVLDVEMHPTESSIGIGTQPQLPVSYSRATVLVNGPGVIVADRQLESKLDWF